MANGLIRPFLRSALFVSAAFATSPRLASPTSAATDLPALELERLEVKPLPWLTAEAVMTAGTFSEAAVPDTLDLAEVTREAVHGLTAFLDDRMHYSGFGHGIFATQPPCLVHDQGQDQNWGKVMEALTLARAMSGSRENLARERASLEAMFSYAELKSHEPYPVPLARILMAADALHRYCPHPELPRLIARQRDWLTARIQPDEAAQQGHFGPATNRWTRDDRTHPIKWSDGANTRDPWIGEKWDHLLPLDVDGDGDLDLLGNVEEHYHRGPDGKDVSWFSVVWFENPLRHP